MPDAHHVLPSTHVWMVVVSTIVASIGPTSTHYVSYRALLNISKDSLVSFTKFCSLHLFLVEIFNIYTSISIDYYSGSCQGTKVGI
jgi:hypothetical protein